MQKNRILTFACCYCKITVQEVCMKTNTIKQHNKNIDNAVNLINFCYKNIYGEGDFPRTVNEEYIKKNCLIKSVKAFFKPKKYVLAGYNKLVTEYNILLAKKNFEYLNIIHLQNKNHDDRIIFFKSWKDKYTKLFNQISKDETFEQCKKLCDKLEAETKNLTATKTEQVSKLETSYTSHTSTILLPTALGTIIPMSSITMQPNTTIKHETKTVPDEEKRVKAKKKIAELNKQIAELPNVERNLKIYDIYKDINTLTCNIMLEKSLKRDAEFKLQISKNNAKVFEDTSNSLIKVIDAEKDILLLNYPKITMDQLLNINEDIILDENKHKTHGKDIIAEQKSWQEKYETYKSCFNVNELQK